MDKNYYYMTRPEHKDRVIVELRDDELQLWQSSGRILEPVMKYDGLDEKQAKVRYYSATPVNAYWSWWDRGADFVASRADAAIMSIRNFIRLIRGH